MLDGASEPRLRLGPSKNDRRWIGALSTSTAVHVAILAALACYWLPTVTATPVFYVNSRWSSEQPAVVPELYESVAIETDDTSEAKRTALFLSAGGGRSASPVIVPSAESYFSVEAFASAFNNENPGEFIGALATGQGEGQSSGSGDGTGHAGGFFGTRPDGNSIVYVVDCSRSMNHPHESEAKTRFRRLKMELVQSIGTMKPEQRFFIIYFNNEAIPMPATTMQPAIPASQSQFLNWAASMRAFGHPTDPRKAISLALTLQPDVIYLLTDGSFAKECERDLKSLRQSGTSIHTFAFGESDGEAVLTDIAKNNKGEYHFIP